MKHRVNSHLLRCWCIDRLTELNLGYSSGRLWQWSNAKIAFKLGLTSTKLSDNHKARSILEDKYLALESTGQTVPRPVTHARKVSPYDLAFYESREWRELRYRALKASDGRCQCCGRSPSHGIVLHVDHIKPKSKFPRLALAFSNLQVLCDDCNIGKSNKDATDWAQMRADEETDRIIMHAARRALDEGVRD